MFRAQALTVVDTQSVTTSYVVGEYNSTVSGLATGIQAAVLHGTVTKASTSPHTLFSFELNP